MKIVFRLTKWFQMKGAVAFLVLLLSAVGHSTEDISESQTAIDIADNTDVLPPQEQFIPAVVVEPVQIPIRPKRVKEAKRRLKVKRAGRVASVRYHTFQSSRSSSSSSSSGRAGAQGSRSAQAGVSEVARASGHSQTLRSASASQPTWTRQIFDVRCCNKSYVFDPPICTVVNADRSEHRVEESRCPSPKPDSNRPCISTECFWSYSVALGDCSATCGSGTRRPIPTCVDSTGAQTDPNCCRPIPIDENQVARGSRACEYLQPCPTPYVPPIQCPQQQPCAQQPCPQQQPCVQAVQTSTCTPCTSYPCPQVCAQPPCQSPCCSGNCHHGYNPYSQLGCVQPPCYQQPCNYVPCQQQQIQSSCQTQCPQQQPCAQQPCPQPQPCVQTCTQVTPTPTTCHLQRHPGSCYGDCGMGQRKIVLSCICNGVYSDITRCHRVSTEEFESCPLLPCTERPVIPTPAPCHWQWSSWSSCVPRQCGPGHRTRQRQCVDSSGNECNSCAAAGFSEQIDESHCESTPCCKWVIDYRGCSAPCGRGHQEAHYRCESLEGDAGADEACCRRLAKPKAEKIPCYQSCCDLKWIAREWSSCNCYENRRTRLLDCMCDGTIVDEAQCRTVAKLAVSETCPNSECCQWKVDDHWSQCSRTCGEGMQTRAAQCYNTHTHARCASEEFCDDTPPVTSRPCNLRECCTWSVTNIQKCDCRNHKQLYRVECKCHGGVAADSICLAQPDNRIKPLLEEDCPVDYSCYKWDVTKHHTGQTCLAIAGHINVHVTVDCVTKSTPHTIVSESYCRTHTKPTTVDREYLPACPVYHTPCPVWKAGLWGACLPSEDGKFEQSRIVQCVDDHTMLEMPNESDCITLRHDGVNPKPVTERQCMMIRIRRHKGSFRRLRVRRVKKV